MTRTSYIVLGGILALPLMIILLVPPSSGRAVYEAKAHQEQVIFDKEFGHFWFRANQFGIPYSEKDAFKEIILKDDQEIVAWLEGHKVLVDGRLMTWIKKHRDILRERQEKIVGYKKKANGV
jgi:succinate dehydrogenase flavin-adding protein (antitoxin of CptAB toxin-antitoxin module)